MPNKKLTDNEIKKALECCRTNLIDDCKRCNLRLEDGAVQPFCTTTLIGNALDLINRLQAENERLNFVRTRDAQRYEEKISNQAHTNCVLIDLHSATIKEVKELEEKLKTAKAEAYKEFAERLKNNFKCGDDVLYEQWLIHWEIDNLLKEMVGEDK